MTIGIDNLLQGQGDQIVVNDKRLTAFRIDHTRQTGSRNGWGWSLPGTAEDVAITRSGFSPNRFLLAATLSAILAASRADEKLCDMDIRGGRATIDTTSAQEFP